jgi:hypothetical protein
MRDRYAELRAETRVRERPLLEVPRIPNELELQARWFSGEFGRQFTSTAGDSIEIVQFGTWNREAGPDFSDVVVAINGGKGVRGTVEIDLLDRNWETHGHSTSPAFEDTVLHVFVDKSEREFFTRTAANRNVAQVRIDPAALAEAFNSKIPLARPGRCHAPLKTLPEERVSEVLNSAARFRLQQKALRLRRKIENHGVDEALFQEIAGALGYKENKLPFTLLAQRLPLRSLREHGADTEALLFGLAGFLEAPDLSVYKARTREYVGTLWKRWWLHRERLQRLAIPRTTWKATGTRPANHPQRRLAALAVLAQNWSAFRRSLGKRDLRAMRRFFFGLDHPFWRVHYTLPAEAVGAEMALVGESRVTDILANVFFPYWMEENVEVWGDYTRLSARLSNRRIETGAARLFGDDPRRAAFLKTVAHQQGLLQIYEDFCLQDDSDCAQCPFPEQMQKWR